LGIALGLRPSLRPLKPDIHHSRILTGKRTRGVMTLGPNVLACELTDGGPFSKRDLLSDRYGTREETPHTEI
jgi:hypothetical protein